MDHSANQINLIQLIKRGLFQQNSDPFPSAPNYSSVALILKPSNQAKYVGMKHDNIFGFDILLLRRKPHNNDYYSGHVCFPGGKIQKDEHFIDSAVRQTFQQTGLKLQKQKHLIFTIKRRFVARLIQIKGQWIPLMVNASIFFIDQISVPIKIDQKQISQFQWIPLRHFLQAKSVRCFVQHSNFFYTLSGVTNISEQEKQQIHKNFQKISMPACNVNMEMPVFGFTFYILGFLYIKIYNYGKSTSTFDKQISHKIQELEEHMWNIKATFNKNFPKKQQAANMVVGNYRKLRIIQITKRQQKAKL